MDIIAFVEAPIGLVAIINTAFKGLEDRVEHVYIGAELKGMEGRVGALDVGEDGTMDVFIDLQNCAESMFWCDKGMLYVPNVWYNVLYAVYHERAHVKQIARKSATNEHTADLEAIECLYKWSKTNTVPTLASMGWMGERIRKVLNSIYHKHPNVVDEEIDVIGTGAVARAGVTASASGSFETPEEIAALNQHIKEGHAGLMVKGRTYLNAEEFFCIDEHQAYSEELVNALTGVMVEQKEIEEDDIPF